MAGSAAPAALVAARTELTALTDVVELSTLSLESKRRNCARLAVAGIAMLDCPISGTGAQAETAGQGAGAAPGGLWTPADQDRPASL